MTLPAELNIRQKLSLPVPTPEEYAEIRNLWIAHSKAEDARDLNGLIATLSENCVYEIVPTGQRWEGHDGARNFYLTFLGAFPDVHFDMYEIAIGPQGVFEVAKMTGTHKGEWAGIAPTGKFVETDVIIFFPWNPVTRKFDGERVWFDRMAMQLGND
jgi:predicted ester cyclase